MSNNLAGKIALVTGASRGVGKGIALGLGEAGATVYITGRTVNQVETVDGLGGTIYETAAEVEKQGGRCIPIQCDHRRDEDVKEVFRNIEDTHGKLDLLVNNVWGGYEQMVEMKGDSYKFTWSDPFWEQPVWRWDAMFAAGVRAHYVSSQYAARLMVTQRTGLIINISFWSAQKYMSNVAYGVAKAATDKMVKDMAYELLSYNVSSVALYPGLVRTEGVMRYAETFDMSNSESPLFVGRSVAALASDPNIISKSGNILYTADLAQEYGFTDIDGNQPRPLTIEEA